jgi:hypothetical protein
MLSEENAQAVALLLRSAIKRQRATKDRIASLEGALLKYLKEKNKRSMTTDGSRFTITPGYRAMSPGERKRWRQRAPEVAVPPGQIRERIKVDFHA